MQRKSIQEETSWQQCSGGQSVKKHRGNNVAEVNPGRNIAATLQRRSIQEEISRQQCSGSQFVEKYYGNNVSRLNQLRWMNVACMSLNASHEAIEPLCGNVLPKGDVLFVHQNVRTEFAKNQPIGLLYPVDERWVWLVIL
jgi:hypothetical protein